MKNIWIINHYGMPPKYETRVRNNVMAKYLIEKGYKVKIFSASTLHNTNINLIQNKKTLFIERNYDGLDFVHIRTSDYTGNGFSRIINMLQFPLRLFKVAKEIGEKPDIIISDLEAIFAWAPYWISRKTKSQFIMEVRDLWPESIVVYNNIPKSNPIIWFLYKVEKWIYKKTDSLVFCMEGGKDYITDKGWDKDIDMLKIHHINNGVDLELFNYNKECNKIDDFDLDDESTFKVVYAGSIRLVNNVRKIVDVAEEVAKLRNNQIKFFIYGDGPDRKALENYCVENNINNVLFKGHVDKNKIPYILSKCDLNIMHFAQTSLKKYGSSMNKMFDYLASGKPSLSDCEFGYDIFNRYKCGLSLDNADPKIMAKGVLKFYDMSEEEYNSYCTNALIAAKDFDFKVLTDKLEQIF